MMTNEERPRVHMIGHAHIDPMFVWRWMEGYEAVKMTFRSALERMDETPGFCLSTSSAAFFAWLERWDPELFQRVRERIQEGRWELVGGWWIEPDCNVPHGESLVRQALYGQRYFRAKFGVQAVVGMNPDTFGHAATLPQILAKSGCKYYMFMRPSWYEKELPGNLFWWVGPDGSRVLTARLNSYAGHATPIEIAEVAETEFYATANKVCFFGVGDHGGGPTQEAIARVEAKRAAGENVQFSRAETFFREVEGEGAELPEVQDELQHHARGCYSTLAALKNANRGNEHLLMAAEKACAVAYWAAAAPYPANALTSAWRDLCFLQFHDTLGGTIPKDAYEDSMAQQGRVTITAQEALHGAMHALSNVIDTTGEGFPILVFNPTGQRQLSPLEIAVDRGHWGVPISFSNEYWRGGVRVLDEADGEVTAQLAFPTTYTGYGRVNLLFLADVPPLGYRVYRVFPPDADQAPNPNLVAGDTFLENGRWRLELDPASGAVVRLLDKRNALEVLCAPGNRAVVMDDPSDTWAHEVERFDQEIGAFGEAEISVLEEGPVRASLYVRSRYGDSRLEQVISLYDGLDGIYVQSTVNWGERHKALKIEWPVNVAIPTVTSEVPYGHVVRLSKGQEEPCGRWIDVSGQARREMTESVPYGVALINDGKAGYDVWARYRPYGWGPGKAIMRMTVLRSPAFIHHEPTPIYPGLHYPYQDQGEHTYRYVILPHQGDWRDAGVPQQAEAFNLPVAAMNAEKHAGRLSASASFLVASPSNAQVSVVKVAEDGDDLVIRCVETHGRDVEASIELPHWGIGWTLPLGHDEIKTFRVSREGEVFEVDLLEDRT